VRVGRSEWVGLLAFSPVIAIGVLLWLAFSVPVAHGHSRWWSAALLVPGLKLVGFWLYAFTLPSAPEVEFADAWG